MVQQGKNLSPKAWIRYWWFAVIVVGPACMVIGIVTKDLQIVFFAAVMIFFGLAMIGFWRRKIVDAESPATSVGPPPAA